MFFVPQLCGGISIHALREEGDRKQRESHKHKEVFLSTPSARRATVSQALNFAASVISIHALREEGDAYRRCSWLPAAISIHALREEGDGSLSFGRDQEKLFLSTPSARRATRGCPLWISPTIYFYPRPPRGGRPGG